MARGRLSTGQAPGPTHILTASTRTPHPLPLSGLAEKRLARLAGCTVRDLWRTFDRCNLLSTWPGTNGRKAEEDPSVDGAHSAAFLAGVGLEAGQRAHTRPPTRLREAHRAHSNPPLRRSTTSPYFRQWKGGGPNGSHSQGDKFPLQEARERARALKQCIHHGRYKLVVVLGLNVARAFGFRRECTRLLSHDRVYLDRSMAASTSDPGARVNAHSNPPHTPRGACVEALLLPHPSGISHFWNSKQNVERASNTFRTAIQQLHGSTG